jgi:hypothetical protein
MVMANLRQPWWGFFIASRMLRMLPLMKRSVASYFTALSANAATTSS